MKIVWTDTIPNIRRFSSLETGDCFMLPRGETVYMKIASYPAHHDYALNLANGNSYDWGATGDKQVIKVEAELHVDLEPDC